MSRLFDSRSLKSFIADLRQITVLLRGVDSPSPYILSVYTDRLENLAREVEKFNDRSYSRI